MCILTSNHSAMFTKTYNLTLLLKHGFGTFHTISMQPRATPGNSSRDMEPFCKLIQQLHTLCEENHPQYFSNRKSNRAHDRPDRPERKQRHSKAVLKPKRRGGAVQPAKLRRQRDKSVRPKGVKRTAKGRKDQPSEDSEENVPSSDDGDSDGSDSQSDGESETGSESDGESSDD